MNLYQRLILLFVIVVVWADSAEMTQQARTFDEQRTALTLLYLLGYPPSLQQTGQYLGGLPIRRPFQDQHSSPPDQVEMDDVAQVSAMDPTDMTMIREEFIKGVLQGLVQQAASSDSPTIQPNVLADFIEQAASATSSRPPGKSEKDADYDYIDFKNGGRIQYDLNGHGQLPSEEQYPTKILQAEPQQSQPQVMLPHPLPRPAHIYTRTRPQLYFLYAG